MAPSLRDSASTRHLNESLTTLLMALLAILERTGIYRSGLMS